MMFTLIQPHIRPKPTSKAATSPKRLGLGLG